MRYRMPLFPVTVTDSNYSKPPHFREKRPPRENFQNSVPKVFIATPIDVLCTFREIWPTGNRALLT